MLIKQNEEAKTGDYKPFFHCFVVIFIKILHLHFRIGYEKKKKKRKKKKENLMKKLVTFFICFEVVYTLVIFINRLVSFTHTKIVLSAALVVHNEFQSNILK